MGDDICKSVADEHITALQQSDIWHKVQTAVATGQLGVQQALDKMNDLVCKAVSGKMHFSLLAQCCTLAQKKTGQ